MASSRHTPNGIAATELVLETFRFNGRLLSAGDRLVGELGLTSARWQVLGAIALSPAFETVARLARNMGVHRQGVQRIVNELAKEGLVEFRPNPHHRRANLVVLTRHGREIYEKAERLQIPWINSLSEDLAAEVYKASEKSLKDRAGWSRKTTISGRPSALAPTGKTCGWRNLELPLYPQFRSIGFD